MKKPACTKLKGEVKSHLKHDIKESKKGIGEDKSLIKKMKKKKGNY
ncbi:MAG: hypothetical protein IMZ64_05085 [Bacteroidetes bacterium]|nr:hypothetical protein [Bacteroidota bacterium]